MSLPAPLLSIVGDPSSRAPLRGRASLRGRAALVTSCVLALLGAPGCAPPHPLTWTVDFEPTSLRTRAALVHTEIREGGCAGRVRYASDVRPGEPASMPPVLPSGTWGFAADALSEDCIRFASTCEEIRLPGPTRVTSVLRSVSEEAACGADSCSSGACARPDAGVDASMPVDAPLLDGSTDGGRDAASCPDAPRDTFPLLLPYLPCGGRMVTDESLLSALEVRTGTLTAIPNFFHEDGICTPGCTAPVIQLSAGTELRGHFANVSEISLLVAQQMGGGSLTIEVCGSAYHGPTSLSSADPDPGFVNVPPSDSAPIATMSECEFSIRATGGVVTIHRFDVACHPSAGPVVSVEIDGMARETLPGPANAVLSWSATGATSCEGMGAWSGPQHMTGSVPLLDLCAGRYSYALSCSHRGGTSVIDIAELTVE